MSREDHDRLGTADLVAGADHREMRDDARQDVPPEARREMHGDRPGQQQQPMPPQQMQAQMRPDGSPQAPMHPDAARHPQAGMGAEAAEPLAALFPPQVAQDFRSRWDQVQIGFVDDPQRAVQQADELVAQVMKSLAATFADQRSRLEAGLGREGNPDTEGLRMALRGYRSFFQRLLSL
jgi:hypothetical protein